MRYGITDSNGRAIQQATRCAATGERRGAGFTTRRIPNTKPQIFYLLSPVAKRQLDEAALTVLDEEIKQAYAADNAELLQVEEAPAAEEEVLTAEGAPYGEEAPSQPETGEAPAEQEPVETPAEEAPAAEEEAEQEPVDSSSPEESATPRSSRRGR